MEDFKRISWDKMLLDPALPNDAGPDDPSPLEIRQACIRIRSTWSETERLHRAGIRVSGQARFNADEVVLVN